MGLTLPSAKQLIFDKFFEAVSQLRAAIDNARNLLPMERIPLAILLEERRRSNHVFIQLCRRVEDLEMKLDLTLSQLEDER